MPGPSLSDVTTGATLFTATAAVTGDTAWRPSSVVTRTATWGVGLSSVALRLAVTPSASGWKMSPSK